VANSVLQTINHTLLANLDKKALIALLESLTDDNANLRAQYAKLLAKLDADTGVDETDYAATCGLAAPQFTK
jgi:hypothetical protein